jgi:hypothetical protein
LLCAPLEIALAAWRRIARQGLSRTAAFLPEPRPQ